MKVGKPKSKRVPVRLREKIVKSSAAKQRKGRKEAKKNPQWISKLKKDIGIPNSFPFKNEILQEIEEKRKLRDEDNARRRALAKAAKAGGEAPTEGGEAAEGSDDEFARFDVEDGEDSESDEEGDSMMVDEESADPMAALLASARARASAYEKKRNGADPDAMDEDSESDFVGSEADESADEGTRDIKTRQESSRKQFDKVYKTVVDAADVILYVVDARDPEGTRSKEVERMVMAASAGSKRMIFILNKIDLVPPPVLQKWLAYLRRSFPTIPLRAAKPAPNAKVFEHRDLTIKGTSETLFKALKTFAESRQLKRSVKVGIIGYPNVGKSSVINALTGRMGGRTGTCPTGAEAGVTTSLREVKLDNKLKLLDSPGIVFPNAPLASTSAKQSKIEEQARLILLNAIPPKEITDPVPAVTLLLKRSQASPEILSKLLAVYDLPPLASVKGDLTNDFLVQVARKRGRLGKGGVPNIYSAAQTVLTDWRDGRIQGWTDPPAVGAAAKGKGKGASGLVGDQKDIVTQWAAEFKLEGLWGDDAHKSASGAGDAMEV